MKHCPFYFEEILSQEDENISWSAHLENVHNTNENNLIKVFPFLQLGLPLFNNAFYPLINPHPYHCY
jgi:hypothetical protein